jgi:hypothetical protein
VFLLLAVVGTATFALSRTPMVQLSATLAAYSASTVLLGAGWWRSGTAPTDVTP